MSSADLPTCRPADLPTCRPADLATWRLGDLATWRLGDLAIGAWMTIGVPTLVPCSVHSVGVSWASPNPSQLFTSPSNCPKACSGISSRHYLPSVKPPFLIGNSEAPNLPKPESPLGIIFQQSTLPNKNSEEAEL